MATGLTRHYTAESTHMINQNMKTFATAAQASTALEQPTPTADNSAMYLWRWPAACAYTKAGRVGEWQSHFGKILVIHDMIARSSEAHHSPEIWNP